METRAHEMKFEEENLANTSQCLLWYDARVDACAKSCQKIAKVAALSLRIPLNSC